MNQTPENESASRKRLLTLCFLAIGVVYGDIGTSPLYAFREAFNDVHGVLPLRENVLGVLSLIFWSLITVVSIKYATFILRADNKGEGGVMALMALAQRGVRRVHTRWIVMVIGLFGTSLFFGDAVVTPAISVLSAVEGIEVLSPASVHYVMPISATRSRGVIRIYWVGEDMNASERYGREFSMAMWYTLTSEPIPASVMAGAQPLSSRRRAAKNITITIG